MNVGVSELVGIVNQQFRENSFKNIFCTIGNQIHFNITTQKGIQQLNESFLCLTREDKNVLLLNYIRGFIKTFYETDPYLNFTDKDQLIIGQIYLLLQCDISNNLPMAEIENRHYERIRRFIKTTNPSIYEINHNSKIEAEHFICSEYSSEFQWNLLRLDEQPFIEPILDIGCGEHGHLVEFFRSNNLKAYGIDRLQKNGNYFSRSNWLEFNYGNQRWGTIISNLSFSSHFLHHYGLKDGFDIVYAKTYMKILKSLAVGGSWTYAPSLPFIEKLLPRDQYQVHRSLIDTGFYKTVIYKF